MIDKNNVQLKIKEPAQELIKSKIKPGSIVLLALNDGSNAYSKLGGTCTIGANFQLVVLNEKDPHYDIKVKNNMDLDLYTSGDELQFLENGLVLNARNAVLSLSSDEGIIDGAVTINTDSANKKLTKEEMKNLGGKIC
ncbi:iron-sulfur cluster biosynthesis family protein [Lactobacillus sp. PV034]|uniref:iron-sulfur cluster biosynthesis family protein n=1 Tax=Lactobacillus sp. PV034 TaxID=2594495 RepID=UPI00223EF832|nr:iron-sulfur cluster biosynthesis family protein [Lactobacillus sp. PV034]QNQ81064.1 iron-sulfur cluster biosynthesis family protein [Lactobacillus sp. PV034]